MSERDVTCDAVRDILLTLPPGRRTHGARTVRSTGAPTPTG